jgi:hypothetical protein
MGVALAIAGCAQQQPHMNNADISRIMSDPRLSQHEKDEELDALATPAESPITNASHIMFGVGTMLLVGSVGTLIARRRRYPPEPIGPGKYALQDVPPPPPPPSVAITPAPEQPSPTPSLQGSESAEPARPRFTLRLRFASKGSGSSAFGRDRTKKKKPQPKETVLASAAEATGVEGQMAPVRWDEFLPKDQEDVDAILPEERGVSFFTSRPIPLDELTEVSVVVGEREQLVPASMEEAEEIAAGRTLKVRAFTIDGLTRPWYEWEKYDPYRDYWTADDQEWRGFVDGAIACWIATTDCPTGIDGYLALEDGEEEDADVAGTGDEAAAS